MFIILGAIKLDSGVINIFYNGAWGTVCDDSFDDIDAHVACKQLGYKYVYLIKISVNIL